MKFIDEKGRIFGKLNIIDILIVAVVILALLGVNYKFGLLEKFSPKETVQKPAIVKLWVKNVSNYTVASINEGDTVKELKSNATIGKIVQKEARPGRDYGTDAEGKWVLSEVPEKGDVFITLETNSPLGTQDIKLGSKEAKVGASLEIKGPKFQVTAYVIGVE